MATLVLTGNTDSLYEFIANCPNHRDYHVKISTKLPSKAVKRAANKIAKLRKRK